METLTRQAATQPVEAQTTACQVNSYNEWDPLEEVIVGRLEGATIPPGHITVTYNVPRAIAQLVKLFGGMRYPGWMKRAAARQLDEFIHILEGEVVYRHGDKTYSMSPGDSLFFDAEAPHGPEELRKLPIRFICVISYRREE